MQLLVSLLVLGGGKGWVVLILVGSLARSLFAGRMKVIETRHEQARVIDDASRAQLRRSTSKFGRRREM